MRILLATSAAILALAGVATPAFAQYGGSPQEQVDGAPQEPDANAPDADEDDSDRQGEIVARADGPDELEVRADGYDKPGADEGEDYAAYAGDVDADADVDLDEGDVDFDQGDVGDEVDHGEVDEDQAEPGPGGQVATWQGEDGRTYCRRSDGSTGLIVGGGAGALVGRGIDGGRHRGTGTILGAIAGAIVGSAIERSANQQSCR